LIPIFRGRMKFLFNFFLSLLLSLLLSCENDLSDINKVSSPKEASVETGKDIEVLYSSQGKVKARMQAPSLLRHRDKNPYSELPDGLKIIFFDDSLKQESKLTARYGVTYEKSHEMIVRDSVVVVNVKGEKLETEELIWNDQTEKITSNKFVKIQTADEIIYGDGLEANSDLTNYKIKKIRGTIKLKESPLK